MRKIFTTLCIMMSCVFIAAGMTGAADSSSAKQKGVTAKQQQESSAGVSGTVVDTMDSGGYTYVQLDQGGKKIWVATTPISVKKGQKVTFRPGMEMQNFESKTLKRTFDRIIFSAGLADNTSSAAGEMKTGGSKGSIATPQEKITVEKATGANAYTVSEVYKNQKALHGKSVTVKAKVVKVSAGVMKMNWIHLQDGTGDVKKGTHDLVATSSELPAVGDIVTASGTVAANKDFGSGYKYAVMLEKASFKK